MRGFPGLFLVIIILLLLQVAWPVVLVFLVYTVIRYIVFRVRLGSNDRPYDDDQQQVNEDWARRAGNPYTTDETANKKDVIDAEYTEHDADPKN